MHGWRMYITKRSTNVIKEARNYTWDRDKDGNLVNTPIDAWNHAMDAIRYGLYSEFAGHEGKGQYNISVKRY
jgi:phage terminase large subunit